MHLRPLHPPPRIPSQQPQVCLKVFRPFVATLPLRQPILWPPPLCKQTFPRLPQSETLCRRTQISHPETISYHVCLTTPACLEGLVPPPTVVKRPPARSKSPRRLPKVPRRPRPRQPPILCQRIASSEYPIRNSRPNTMTLPHCSLESTVSWSPLTCRRLRR